MFTKITIRTKNFTFTQYSVNSSNSNIMYAKAQVSAGQTNRQVLSRFEEIYKLKYFCDIMYAVVVKIFKMFLPNGSVSKNYIV